MRATYNARVTSRLWSVKDVVALSRILQHRVAEGVKVQPWPCWCSASVWSKRVTGSQRSGERLGRSGEQALHFSNTTLKQITLTSAMFLSILLQWFTYSFSFIVPNIPWFPLKLPLYPMMFLVCGHIKTRKRQKHQAFAFLFDPVALDLWKMQKSVCWYIKTISVLSVLEPIFGHSLLITTSS